MTTDKEKTLVLIKPDGVQRGLIGQVISKLERRGLKIVALKMLSINHELASRHYSEHIERPFYKNLIEFIISSPVVATVFEGPDAVTLVRKTMGATNPLEASPGTIRGDMGITIDKNIIHGSDSIESADKEIALFFQPEEILTYQRNIDAWITES